MSSYKFSQLYKLAFFDKMTDCYNRNWLEEHRCKFDKQEMIIAIVDLNRLKETNDIQGHEVGDARIKNLATFLKQYGRVVRLGGDEFLVIFDHDKETLFERYCNKIEFSYGIARKELNQNLTDAMRNADKKMYRMKKGEIK